MRQLIAVVLIAFALVAFAQEGEQVRPRIDLPGEKSVERQLSVTKTQMETWELTREDQDALNDRLAREYPDDLREIGGDLGVCVFEFEIWKSICLFGYQFLSVGASEQDAYLIISLDRLLFLKALGMKEAKYHKDLELIVDKVLQVQYEDFHSGD